MAQGSAQHRNIQRWLEECSGDSGVDEDGEMSDDDGEQNGTVSDFSSSCSEDDGNTEIENSYREKILISRNQKEEWSTEPHATKKGRTQAHNILRQSLGPSRYAVRNVDSVSSALLLFLRPNILDIVRKWTNNEGHVVYQALWKEVSDTEIKKFLGLLILIGVYKSKNENVSQLWSKLDGRPIFNSIMSRDGFKMILRVLRFDNATERRKNRGEDKLQPIREIFDMWNENLKDAFVPGSCMMVDEQLLTFRGRCPFRQFIPSKPGKYGIKIWAMSDSSNPYTWKMQVYTGRDSNKGREGNQGERVVMVE
jgi:hypothetical protein